MRRLSPEEMEEELQEYGRKKVEREARQKVQEARARKKCRRLLMMFAKVVISLLCAGIFYSASALPLVIFHLAGGFSDSTYLLSWGIILFWLVARVGGVAAGFAVGIMIFERLTKASRTKFFRIFAWPLVGCIIGAVASPMLLEFGLFMAGAASVVLREVAVSIRKTKS